MPTNSDCVPARQSARPPGVLDKSARCERGRPLRSAAKRSTDRPSIDPSAHASQRARETWERASATYSGEPDLRIDDRVYEADVEDLMAVLQSLPVDARVVVLVGHNPGLEDLVEELAGTADKNARAQLDEKFPTSAIAVLEASTAWAELQGGGAYLASLTIPRG